MFEIVWGNLNWNGYLVDLIAVLSHILYYEDDKETIGAGIKIVPISVHYCQLMSN